MNIYVILHNIRSAHNVGSVFRTSDGAGVTKIFLTGYTPAPIDRFGREQKEISKTSLGAVSTIPHESISDIKELILRLKKDGVSICGVEQSLLAVPYKTYNGTKDVAFIFGNEITGIEEDVLKEADTIIHIPMKGKKESLNVAVCAGIILFSIQ